MRKVCIALLACVSLTMLGLEALTPEDYIYQTTEQAAPPPLTPTKETTVEKHCHRGPRGHRGKKGKRGKRGRRGTDGETFVDAYAEAYLNELGGTTLLPLDLEPVAFNAVGPLLNISVDPNYTFTVLTGGVYTIEYAVKGSSQHEPPSYPGLSRLIAQLEINGAPVVTRTYVPGVTAIPVGGDTTLDAYAEASNQVTLALSAGDEIQLKVQAIPYSDPQCAKYGAFQAVDDTNTQECAYISIEKIG